MDSKDSNTIKNDSSKKPSYGYTILAVLLLLGAFDSFVEHVEIQSSVWPLFVSIIAAFLGVSALYFVVLWIWYLFRRRGGVDRPENKIARRVINILFAIILLAAIARSAQEIYHLRQIDYSKPAFFTELIQKQQGVQAGATEAASAGKAVATAFSNQDWSKMDAALQNMLNIAERMQPQIDELKIYVVQNPGMFEDGEDDQLRTLYIKMLDVRDRHNKKLIELASFGLTVEWSNSLPPDKWLQLVGQLGVIEQELQVTATELEAA